MQEQKAQLLSQARNSLVVLGKLVMKKAFWSESPPFHNEISNVVLDKKHKLVNIIAPRGSAKSTIAAILNAIHHVMFEDGKKLVVLVSRTQGHSIHLLQTIKEIFEYDYNFRALFGTYNRQNAIRWSNEAVEFPQFSIICKGTGQQLRGLNIRGQRPTLIIVDDPEDESNTKTPESMKNNFDWLLGAAEPSLDPRRGRIIVIGTPLHQRCIVMSLGAMDTWHTKHYSYLYRNGEPVFMLTKDRSNLTSLWPDMKPVSELLEHHDSLASIGRASLFYKERLCWVTGDEDQLFKDEYIRYWEGKPEIHSTGSFLELTKKDKNLAETLRIPINIFMGVDPASSTKQTADYSCIMVVAVDEDMNRYVLEYFRQRVSPLTLGEKIIQFYNKYKPIRTKIESVGYQEMLREYVANKVYIPGIAHKAADTQPRNSKSARLETLQPLFAQGNVFVKKEMEDFISELVLYPMAKNDDTLDAFYYAVIKNYPPTHGEEKAVGNKKVKERYYDWMLS